MRVNEYIYKLKRIEMRLAILMLQKNPSKLNMPCIKKCNFDFEIGLF